MLYFFFALLSFPVYAGNMTLEQCASEHNPDKFHLCHGVATLDVADCDKIVNFELKKMCYKQIRDTIREQTWRVHPQK